MSSQTQILDRGSKYGYLTVLKCTDLMRRSDGRKVRCAVCECVCGTIKEVRVYSLTYGYTKSCGCKSHQLGLDTKRERMGLPQYIPDIILPPLDVPTIPSEPRLKRKPKTLANIWLIEFGLTNNILSPIKWRSRLDQLTTQFLNHK